MNEILTNLAKTVADDKELLRLIYRDLAQPGVKQTGKALETILGLGNTFLIPLRLLNEKASLVFRANMEKYRVALKEVPSESIQEVPPEVGVPILDRLTYVNDQALSEMFVNLLAKASQTQNADQAHPAFISIIDNLCPDEALLLRALSPHAINRYGDYGFVFSANKNLIYDTVHYLLDPHILARVNLQYPDYVAAYVQNLKRLGIIESGEFRPIDENDVLCTRIKADYSDAPKRSHWNGLTGVEVEMAFWGHTVYRIRDFF